MKADRLDEIPFPRKQPLGPERAARVVRAIAPVALDSAGLVALVVLWRNHSLKL